MRHQVKGKQLNRDSSSRRALFKNLILALIDHGQINTTSAKAKAVQGSLEKLITKAKGGTLHERRQIDQVLNQRTAVNKLVDEIAPHIKRNSGYTRIIKLGERQGDAAAMVRLEIVDWQPKAVLTDKKKTEIKTEKVATKTKTSGQPAASESTASTKVKQPRGSDAPAKHIPQKRMSGGK
jgi:large subunit ribosomal protein L17